MGMLTAKRWISKAAVILGIIMISASVFGVKRADAVIFYQDDKEIVDVTLNPNGQEFWYHEDGSVSGDNFLVWANVVRTEPDRKITKTRNKKVQWLGVTGGGRVGLERPVHSFHKNIPITPFSEGNFYNVCKDKGPVDVRIERQLTMGLDDSRHRTVRTLGIGSATALVHCPETVTAQPPTGPAPRVLTGSTCTRGIDCPPENHSMALGPGAPGTQGTLRRNGQLYTRIPQKGYVQDLSQPNTWESGSAQSVNAPAQGLRPVTPKWQAPRPVNREPVAVARTGSSPGVRAPAPGARSVTTTRQTPGQRGIIVGTARGSGPQSIVVGTCRELQIRPLQRPVVRKDGTGKLLFALPDGRSMTLPDGVYKAQNGIRIHISGGSVALVDGVLPH